MPPRPNADQRTEQRIVGDADHRLDAAGDHRLDEDAVDLLGGASVPSRAPRSRRRRGGPTTASRRFRRTPPTSVLCCTPRADSLATTGNPRTRASADRFVGDLRERAGGQRQAEGAEHGRWSRRRSTSLRRARRPPRGTPSRASSARMSSKLQKQPRRLRAPLRVGRDLRQSARGVFRETRTPARVRAPTIERPRTARSRPSGSASIGLAAAPAARPAAMPSLIACSVSLERVGSTGV